MTISEEVYKVRDVPCSRQHLLKLMLDTNTFDHIYDNDLTKKVQNATDNGKLLLFATDIQKQEIEGTPIETRKQGIKQAVEEIRIKFIETAAAVVALDQQCKKGFHGSRVGEARVVSEDDRQLLEALTKVNIKYLLKNKADLLIFYTAVKENMDYLVTGNTQDFKKPLELFKIERDTKVQVINNTHFEKLL
jgi:hypothetical protein